MKNKKIQHINRLRIFGNTFLINKDDLDKNFTDISLQLIEIVDYLNFNFTPVEKIKLDLLNIINTNSGNGGSAFKIVKDVANYLKKLK